MKPFSILGKNLAHLKNLGLKTLSLGRGILVNKNQVKTIGGSYLLRMKSLTWPIEDLGVITL
jgi:hypothetical protein